MNNKHNRVWPSLVSFTMRLPSIAILMFLGIATAFAQRGATVPWTTYEAENMTIVGGQILGPPPRVVDNNAAATDTVDMEASGRRSEERRVGKEGRSRWSPYH